MAKHTLKILRCSHRKIFKVCLAIFQHDEVKGYVICNKDDYLCYIMINPLTANVPINVQIN